MARVIVVAERETGPPDDLDGDRRTFQLKERVTSSDARDPHVAAQLIERIGWALADAEDVEMRQSAAPEPPRTNGMTALGDGATYGVAGEPDDAIRAVVVPESGSPPTCA